MDVRALVNIAQAARVLMRHEADEPTLLGDLTYADWERSRVAHQADLRAALAVLDGDDERAIENAWLEDGTP